MNSIEIVRPDDWHLHLRDGDVLSAVIPWTANLYGRAIVMPNLKPPVTSIELAAAYRERIIAALPEGSQFRPLMTCYLTDSLEPSEIRKGYEEEVFSAAKLYPAGATTNSDHGVTDLKKIYPVLETMQELQMPVLMHGEVVDPETDVFDREAIFVEKVLDPLLSTFPELKVVLEHVTTSEAVEYVKAQGPKVGATITPHHLMINRNAIFNQGIRPHMYCLPVAKREVHRQSLRKAATSGDSHFFLGTDSAPHLTHLKENDCGCAGVFNVANSIECVTHVFDEENSLEHLEAFTSVNGAEFYGMPLNEDSISLEKQAPKIPSEIAVANDAGFIKTFEPPAELAWRIVG